MRRLQKLEIKLSTLDKQAPPEVDVVFRLTGRPGGRMAPPTLGDYNTLEEAQQRSDFLTAQGEWHGYLTWWKNRKTGQRVNKWATMLAGKRRYFKVSVPYVAGYSDTMIKAFIHQAIVNGVERPAQYTEKMVIVTVDAETNRTELGGVALRLPPELAERARAMGGDAFATLVARALDEQPNTTST